MPHADYNVAPTTHQPIIRQSRETGDRELVLARWGMVPFFTKDLKDIKGLSTINARSEAMTTTPIWREPFNKRDALLVPAAGSCVECPKRTGNNKLLFAKLSESEAQCTDPTCYAVKLELTFKSS